MITEKKRHGYATIYSVLSLRLSGLSNCETKSIANEAKEMMSERKNVKTTDDKINFIKKHWDRSIELKKEYWAIEEA